MTEIRTVTLHHPIPFGKDKTLDRIRLRAPKAGDLRGLRLARLEEAETDAILTIVPRISLDAVAGVHLAELHPSDLLTLTAEVLGFFAPPAAGVEGESPTTPAPPGV
ncbi:phage tail assembly protein [Roseospira marina]|uniref:Phage tail assembly protein n=1 Tax=Roseospira marina TaxID=140057 RepID=A0A5M6I479_9PROT|nr:phage tail assembly protein [Roseospira marina]KAA5602615.1 phage tail assembly protein [Roseospira marina]MBB4316269.1 hypothetical protein [Roseospira marina]MBB5089461.1 hypothetical protein [Roseospira marina]